jgi:hypothetical protein
VSIIDGGTPYTSFVSSPLELEMHRENTLAFIAANPVEVVLTPIATRVRTASGGWVESDGTPRSPQIMRIIELGARGEPATIKLQDGTERNVDFWLLGAYDAAVEVGDHWTAEDGRDWEVGDIIRSNGYETRALVAERGK